jgi:hypothetical protein
MISMQIALKIFAALAIMTGSTVATNNTDVRSLLKAVHLNGGRAKREGMREITWYHRLPPVAIKGNHECSKKEERQILDSVNNTELAIKTAYKNWDNKAN